jgi:hypothetical protein
MNNLVSSSVPQRAYTTIDLDAAYVKETSARMDRYGFYGRIVFKFKSGATTTWYYSSKQEKAFENDMAALGMLKEA